MKKENEAKIEGYAKVLEMAMDIVFMKQAIKEAEEEIKSTLTYSELVNGRFDNGLIQNAFSKASVGVSATEYCRGECTFKNVNVYLHESPDQLTGKAMHEVLKAAEIRK